MKIEKVFLIAGLFIGCICNSQTVLKANGEGNTYEDINAILAPNYDVVEVPDCGHEDFGRHIEEVYDEKLKTYVFKFIAHVDFDDDRCKKSDRQRIEIKTYGQSPDNLKATEGEIVEYKWKFKLPNNFRVSKSFTHLHQIKSVGSKYSSIPMITLTARKHNPDRLELRYDGASGNQNTLATVALDLLKGSWVEVTEIIKYAEKGSYFIEIKKVSNDSKLLEYSKDNLDMWQDGSDFFRPKWGIYRSLNNKEDLKDEEVLFNDFSIKELQPLTFDSIKNQINSETEILAEEDDKLNFKKVQPKDYDLLKLYDEAGNEIKFQNYLSKNKIYTFDFKPGTYYLVFVKSMNAKKIVTCVIK